MPVFLTYTVFNNPFPHRKEILLVACPTAKLNDSLVVIRSAGWTLSGQSQVLVHHEFPGARVSSGTDSEANDNSCKLGLDPVSAFIKGVF